MGVLRAIYRAFDERYHITPFVERNVTKKDVPRTLGWGGCFGGLALVVFLIQVYTGVLLLIYYKPDPARAWDSVTYIKSNVPMGWLIQRVHSVSAHVMIVLVLMHMARVAYYKIYRAPRELHWLSGTILLFLTAMMAFTGYLLPWTNLSYWGASVATEIPNAIPLVGEQVSIWVRRGSTISGETLGFFYAMHIWVLPIVTVIIMGMHFVMIRRTGISRPL
jgi:ubiquinol-cytochrome c reductase cytochrome b subunit